MHFFSLIPGSYWWDCLLWWWASTKTSRKTNSTLWIRVPFRVNESMNFIYEIQLYTRVTFDFFLFWNSSFNCGQPTPPTIPTITIPNKFSGSKAAAACKKYLDAATPYSNWNIINGIPVGQGEYPHMVALGYRNRDSTEYDFDCGGSLIAEQWVVTAAHCIKDRRQPVMIRMGKVCLR